MTVPARPLPVSPAPRITVVGMALAPLRLLGVLCHVMWALLVAFTVWNRYSVARRRAFTIRWSGRLLALLGVRLAVQGQARPGGKLIVANHVSWLDIVAINATEPSRFVSKAEVGQWPVLGRLVTAAGTLYLVRERRRDAMRVLGLMAKALREGDTVAVFPEGTTGTGHGVLPFHPNLFQAAIDADVIVQPVALRFSDATHAISPATAYVGDTTLLQSLWWVVTARGLTVHVHVLPPMRVTHADRRALAEQVQTQVEEAIAPGRP